MTTKQAISVLRQALKNDEGYKQGWIANIAVSMQDAYEYANPEDKKDIHKISNDGAKRFIDLLLKD